VKNVEIGTRLGMMPGLVVRWRKRFHDERLEGLSDGERAGHPRRFPPDEVAEVQAIGYEPPKSQGVPLSRFSCAELHRLIAKRGARRPQLVSEPDSSSTVRKSSPQ
jgi:transposase